MTDKENKSAREMFNIGELVKVSKYNKEALEEGIEYINEVWESFKDNILIIIGFEDTDRVVVAYKEAYEKGNYASWGVHISNLEKVDN